MDVLVGPEQSAFVPGRNIHDNTILAQEIIRGYGQKQISSRCMMKLDLRKAYDSVQWSFLEHLLRAYGFPNIFVGWIMACIQTVSYRICINGQVTDCFPAKKGLRQGCPASPYLFVLAIEYLSRMLKNLHLHKDFRYHPCCAPLKINHLSFEDDLLLFSKGTMKSISSMLQAFDNFSLTSGLQANLDKSEIYFAGITEVKRRDITTAVGLREGSLPFKYLGVPLSSKRLSIAQFQPLFDKLLGKIRHWTSKFLSYGGRLQLVQSVLYAVQNFWSQIFCFPNRVMKMINTICRQFLWSGDAAGRKSPVAWDIVCRPKSEEGLGLAHLETWNRVCFLKMLWEIHLKADKLWIKWIHHFYVKDHDVMQMEVPSHASFLFKKILKMRDKVQQNGDWEQQLQEQIFRRRDMYDILRGHKEKMGWKELVLQNLASPRAKMVLWLVLWERVATKERLAHIHIPVPDTLCPFYKNEVETLPHVIYECQEVRPLWTSLYRWLGRNTPNPNWAQFLPQLCDDVKGKKPSSKALKGLVTELVYSIWQDRNRRVFEDTHLEAQIILKQVVQKIIVRCSGDTKISSFFKKLRSFPVV
ncbi:hypothetical protein OROHE_019787 [Orobanche hederae]